MHLKRKKDETNPKKNREDTMKRFSMETRNKIYEDCVRDYKGATKAKKTEV